MSYDIIALAIFVLGLSFWTGVLHNKVCNIKERLDKNDETTDKVPELMVQVANMVDMLKSMQADVHEMSKQISDLRTDIEVMKK